MSLPKDEVFNFTTMEVLEPVSARWTPELIISSCISCVIVIFNILLAASLVAGKNFNTFTVCVFHMVVLDIAIGALVFPIYIVTHYEGAWRYGEVACKFWVTLDMFLPVLIILTCSVINIERLLEVSWPRYRLWRELWSWKHFLFIWIPWTIAMAGGVPLYAVGTSDNEGMMLNVCFLTWKPGYDFAFTITFSFIPMFLAFVTVIAASIASVLASFRNSKDRIRSGFASSTVALVLVTVSIILMMLPFIILIFIFSAFPSYAESGISHLVFTVLYGMSISNSFIRPLCWLIDPEIRLGYAALFRKCCCCCNRSGRMPLHAANFNNVQYESG